MCQLLRELSGTLSFVEDSTSYEIPIGLPQALQKLLHHIVPDAKILLCPLRDNSNLANYNYSVFDLAELYSRRASGLLEEKEFAKVFGNKPNKFFIVSFPAIEKDNFFSHCAFAHEIGHQVAERYLLKESASELSKKILERIEKERKTDSHLESIFGEAQDPLFKAHARSAIVERIQWLRYGFLHELMSDITAIHLLGPASLLSMFDFAAPYDIDGLPPPGDYHPPWRYRLREAYKEAEHLQIVESIAAISGEASVIAAKDAALMFFRRIKAEVDQTTDHSNLRSRYDIRIAIDLVEETLSSCRDFVRAELDTYRYNKELIMKECPELIVRLSLGVPPNEVNQGDKHVPVDFRSAINAGWFYKLCGLAVPDHGGKKGGPEDLVKLNRLVQKAIELATLQSEILSEAQSEK